MAKILLSMPDLRRRALAEIRQQAGCHNVQDIAVNRVTDERAENNWSLCVLSAGAADANTAARAALPRRLATRLQSDDGLTARHHCGAIQIIWISAIIVRMHPHIGRDLALLGEPARPAATSLATTEALA